MSTLPERMRDAYACDNCGAESELALVGYSDGQQGQLCCICRDETARELDLRADESEET